MDENYVIKQNWGSFTPEEHQIWNDLYRRQQEVLKGRAVQEFLDGIDTLGIASDQIPKFEDLTDILMEKTGWQVVAVPGLVPDDIFFKLLSERKFPSTCFIRGRHQLDYLQEPDIFHDIFGHVPLLVQPVFADYMEAYGKAGLKALGTGSLHYLARLYWYTVEFGLIQTQEGLRTYGSGIVSSYSESIYCLESLQPNRIMFDVERVMRTNYRIDDFQEVYFVVESFEELIEATTQDLMPLYGSLKAQSDFSPRQVDPKDRFYVPNLFTVNNAILQEP